MMEFKDHIEKELFEKIEAYIHNRMDADARAAFEKELEADKALSNEVALQRKLMASVEVWSHNTKESFKASVGKETPVKKIGSAWLYAAAAAAVVLVLLTWLFQNKSGSNEQLYARYFVSDAGLPVVMSGENDRYDFYNGMESYKEGDYEKAIPIWQKTGTLSDTTTYFLGVAQLNNNNAAASVEHLTTIAQDTGSAWNGKAIWYLALAYLKLGEKDKALDWLNKLTGDEQAKLLIQDIQKTLP